VGAKLYLFDKKEMYYAGKAKKKQKSKEKVKDKKVEQSWSASLGGLYKVINWININRIYLPFARLPLPVLNGLGHLLGHFGIGTSRSVQKKTLAALRALHPTFSDRKLNKLMVASSKYMGTLLMDVIFRMTYATDHISKFMDFGNTSVLDAALREAKEKGTGVIVPTLHVGQYFHSPLMIFRHPNKYKMDTIASIGNLPMWEAANRSGYDNLFIFASTRFSKIGPQLERHLHNGHTLLIYHDYSSKSQLRVPFIHGKFPYLIHTPQSYISLHKKTGAIILPAVAVPDGIIGKSRMVYLNNHEIMETSRKYWDAPENEFHGRVSTAINKTLYPYVWQYTHVWEEIMRLWALRIADKIEFPAKITLEQFVKEIQTKMHQILEGSYEPDRPDNVLIVLIDEFLPQILKSLKTPKAILRPHKTKIMLTGMNGIQEMLKLCRVIQKELTAKGETQSLLLLNKFHVKLTNFDV
jgi:lauroyl/myristoyl acyltransferase